MMKEAFNEKSDEFKLRELILANRIIEPWVVRGAHLSTWDSCSWTLTDWGKLFSKKLLKFRCGQKNWKGKEPQWESDCSNFEMTWEDFLKWDKGEIKTNISNEENWAYFDYKYMKDLFKDEELEQFSWDKFGFPERDGDDSTIWIGTSGCYTPMHFDTYGSNLICQVFGSKTWLIFPPKDTQYLCPTRIPYEESSVYSSINFNLITKEHYKLLRNCNPLKITLKAGDVLFLPPKFWHFVQSEDFSISVNTWIEMPNDDSTRIEESIIRILVNFFNSAVCKQTEFDLKLLNPNELGLANSQLIFEDLKNSTQLLSLKKKVIAIDENLKNDCPSLKKRKIEDENSDLEEIKLKMELLRKLIPSLSLESLPSYQFKINEFQKINSESEDKVMNKSNAKESYQTVSNNENDNESPDSSDNNKNLIVSLINSLGHPTILKAISEQFLKNYESSKK